MAARLSNGLIFSEVLADNAGGSAFDTDGDGGANKADEFIEIQTATGDQINLAGIEIWSAKRGQLFEFLATDETAPNGTATVVGQYDGGQPIGFFDAGLPDNNTNEGFLEDGEGTRNDTLFLVDTNTGEFVTLSYGEPAVLLSPPTGFPGTNNLGDESIDNGAPNGTVFIRDPDGNFAPSPNPGPGTPGVPCFVAGTMIDTPEGPRAVETLKAGDHVLTRDAGAQPIRWAGGRKLGQPDLRDTARLQPFCVRAGALGSQQPEQDLWLSPNHRVLVRSHVARRLFGKDEILVPVKALAGCDGIERADLTEVCYHHLLLDAHHILTANGAACESLYLGPHVRHALTPQARQEIMTIFPDLFTADQAPDPARPLARGHKARKLAQRHARKAIDLVRERSAGD